MLMALLPHGGKPKLTKVVGERLSGELLLQTSRLLKGAGMEKIAAETKGVLL